jgi:hypothetical protein
MNMTNNLSVGVSEARAFCVMAARRLLLSAVYFWFYLLVQWQQMISVMTLLVQVKRNAPPPRPMCEEQCNFIIIARAERSISVAGLGLSAGHALTSRRVGSDEFHSIPMLDNLHEYETNCLRTE